MVKTTVLPCEAALMISLAVSSARCECSATIAAIILERVKQFERQVDRHTLRGIVLRRPAVLDRPERMTGDLVYDVGGFDRNERRRSQAEARNGILVVDIDP